VCVCLLVCVCVCICMCVCACGCVGVCLCKSVCAGVHACSYRAVTGVDRKSLLVFSGISIPQCSRSAYLVEIADAASADSPTSHIKI
jgi:hypothetical protein